MKEAYSSSVRTFAEAGNRYGTGGLSKFIMAAGGVIVITGAMWGIVQESRKGEISLDFVYRIVITTTIALFITGNVYRVMDAIHGTGDFVISTVAHYMEEGDGNNALGLSGENSEDHQNAFIDALSTVPGLNGDENGQNTLRDLMDAGEGEANYWAVQQAYETLDLMRIAAYAPMLVCTFMVFMAIFEIRIRQLFSPIAVAWIAFEGGRANGTRFLKKYASCYIKIAFYFVIAAIGSEMTHTFFQNMLTSQGGAGDVSQTVNLLFMLGSNVVAAMAMMQSAGLGDEILGV
jgi:hypothetical protein